MNSCWTREPQLPTRAASPAKNKDVVAIVDVLDTALGESTICGEQSKPLFIGSVMAVLLTPTPPSTGSLMRKSVGSLPHDLCRL